jgi:hypothetical protein
MLAALHNPHVIDLGPKSRAGKATTNNKQPTTNAYLRLECGKQPPQKQPSAFSQAHLNNKQTCLLVSGPK